MIKSLRWATAGAAAMSYLLLSSLPAAATPAPCNTDRTKVEHRDATASTDSGSYVNVPGTRIPFVQGTPGCVIIQFSAEATTDPGAHMFIQAHLDGGALTESPPEIRFVTDEVDGAAHAMNFFVVNAPAGRHVLKMQFRSFPAGTVKLDRIVTIVHFRK